MARYEAEATIEARKRKQETQFKDGIVPTSVPTLAQEPRGESAAIIAKEKFG
jgi:hypothetical protein